MGKRIFATRLGQRMTPATVTVIRSIASGSSQAETVIYTALKGQFTQERVKQQTGDYQEITGELKEVFYFPQVAGELPAITEAHTIRWNGRDRRVIESKNLGGLEERLRVVTERGRVREQ